MGEALARIESGAPTELSVRDVVNQVAKIQDVMKQCMKDGEHYGKIPGCGDKPALLKPGAEKLGFMFRLAPRFSGETPIDLGNGHREYIIRCELEHIGTGQFVGSGVGSCSTMESKYRYRTGPKEFTGKPVPREYWDLRDSNPSKAKELIGGPGHAVGKNESGQWEICLQGEKIEHPDPADHYNTVLKMAKKRAHVDAVITATAASDFFTQDIEDMAPPDPPPPKPQNGKKPVPAPPQSSSTPAPTVASGTISEARQRRLHALKTKAGATNEDLKRVMAKYGYEHTEDIKNSDYEEICAVFDVPPGE